MVDLIPPPATFDVAVASSSTPEPQVSCGVRGKLNPPCNAVGYVDRNVLGINHVYHHPAWRRSKSCWLAQLTLLTRGLSWKALHPGAIHHLNPKEFDPRF